MLSFAEIKEYYIAVRDVVQRIGDYVGGKLVIGILWTLDPSRQRLLAVRLFTQLTAMVFFALLIYALVYHGYWYQLSWVKGMNIPILVS